MAFSIENRIIATAAATVLGVGATACSSSHPNAVPHSGLTKPESKTIAGYCDSTLTYGAGDYINKAGNDLIADTGVQSGTSLEYMSTAQENAPNVAKALAGNQLAQAVIYTILGSEKGTTTKDIAGDANKLFLQMAGNPSKSKSVCMTVEARVIQTPSLRAYHPAQAKIFDPTYTKSKEIAGVNTVDHTPITSDINVFGFTPIAGSKDLARDAEIEKEWGITAEGALLVTSHDEGNFTVKNDGNPVKIDKGPKAPASPAPEKTGTPVSASSKNNQQTKSESGGKCHSCQGKGKCTSCKGGASHTGPVPAPGTQGPGKITGGNQPTVAPSAPGAPSAPSHPTTPPQPPATSQPPSSVPTTEAPKPTPTDTVCAGC